MIVLAAVIATQVSCSQVQQHAKRYSIDEMVKLAKQIAGITLTEEQIKQMRQCLKEKK